MFEVLNKSIKINLKKVQKTIIQISDKHHN